MGTQLASGVSVLRRWIPLVSESSAAFTPFTERECIHLTLRPSGAGRGTGLQNTIVGEIRRPLLYAQNKTRPYHDLPGPEHYH